LITVYKTVLFFIDIAGVRRGLAGKWCHCPGQGSKINLLNEKKKTDFWH
jgi:hypothetical protein